METKELPMATEGRAAGMEPDTALIVQQRQGELIEKVLGSVGTSALHNFPGDKRDQWKMIAKAESGDILKREDIGADTFEVVYFYAHQIQIPGPTAGEFSEPVRVVLMDERGDGVAFVSDGIGKSLARIIQVFGLGPYHPPIRVKVSEIKTRRGFRTYTLVPAE